MHLVGIVSGENVANAPTNSNEELKNLFNRDFCQALAD